MLKRTTRPLPKWKHEAGVAAFADKFIAKQRVIADRFSDFAREHEFAEKAACEAARRGDLAPLVAILRSEGGLHPDTIELVIEFMTGARNPQTGKPRGERGKRRMTTEQREAKNPIHGAAIEFAAIEGLLKQHYPAQSKAAIRERAMDIAAKRAEVTSEKLRGYLNRPRSDRRHRL